MKYLFESYQGEYYISDSSPKDIKTCINNDKIVLYWNENNQQESFKEFFSRININYDNIQKYINKEITQEDLIQDLIDDFNRKNEIIKSLFNLNIISSDDKYDLLRDVRFSKRKHLRVLNMVFAGVEKKTKMEKEK